MLPGLLSVFAQCLPELGPALGRGHVYTSEPVSAQPAPVDTVYADRGSVSARTGPAPPQTTLADSAPWA